MGWVVYATPRPLYPPERVPVPTVQEAGWVQGLVWTGAKNFSPTIRSRTLQPVARHYTEHAVPAHIILYYCYRFIIIIIIIIIIILIIISSSSIFQLLQACSTSELTSDTVNCLAFRRTAGTGDRPYSRSLATQDFTNTGIFFPYSCIMHVYIGFCKISYAFQVLHVIQESKISKWNILHDLLLLAVAVQYISNELTQLTRVLPETLTDAQLVNSSLPCV